jgi:hypothetical protein
MEIETTTVSNRCHKTDQTDNTMIALAVATLGA